jgi:hypothetical protein
VSGADWLSYSLQDFVMFGPQVFLRLFVRINQDLWPWQLLAAGVAIAIPLVLLRQKPGARRLAVGLMAIAWAASGYGFLVNYFGPINWPAAWFGWAFVLQGALLGAAVFFGGAQGHTASPVRFVILWLIVVYALPWMAVAESGQWQALALYGVAPGITAAAGALLVAQISGAWRWLCLPLPVLWSLFSAAMFWVLQTWWLLVIPAATLLLVGVGFSLSPRPARSPD